MKLSLAVIAAAAGTAVGLSTESKAGQSLLSAARRVEENQEIDYAWVADYDIKYQGCHHIKQWNDEADDENDVRIYTKRLVRFRLCPTGSCSASNVGGCGSGYGDYIIDMDTFVEAFVEARRQDTETECENAVNNCQCDGDGQDDGFDEEICQYECLMAAGKDYCIDKNPYVDDEAQEEEQDYDRFFECQQLEWDENNYNKMYDENGDEMAFYAGPYCSEQGGAIKVGVFTDDACTEFAQDISFSYITGYSIPYTTNSIVSEECLSCKEPQNEEEQYNQNNGNDAQDADEVREQCEALYEGAGKCEYDISGPYEKNTNGCNYMEGIKIVRADGMLDVSDARPSAIATAFIVIFAMSFAAMGFYVWYLRTRLGVKQNSLL